MVWFLTNITIFSGRKEFSIFFKVNKVHKVQGTPVSIATYLLASLLSSSRVNLWSLSLSTPRNIRLASSSDRKWALCNTANSLKFCIYQRAELETEYIVSSISLKSNKVYNLIPASV